MSEDTKPRVLQAIQSTLHDAHTSLERSAAASWLVDRRGHAPALNQNFSPLLRRALAECQRWLTPDPIDRHDRIVLAAPPRTNQPSSPPRWRRCTRITLPARAAPHARPVPIPSNDGY